MQDSSFQQVGNKCKVFIGGLEWNTGLEWTVHWNNIQHFSMAAAKASKSYNTRLEWKGGIQNKESPILPLNTYYFLAVVIFTDCFLIITAFYAMSVISRSLFLSLHSNRGQIRNSDMHFDGVKVTL